MAPKKAEPILVGMAWLTLKASFTTPAPKENAVSSSLRKPNTFDHMVDTESATTDCFLLRFNLGATDLL